MSASFAEAFKKNGIEFKPLLEDYINFSDIKLPFGENFTDSASTMKTEVVQKIFKGINYIRRNATDMKISDLNTKVMKLTNPYDLNYYFLCKMLDNDIPVKEIHLAEGTNSHTNGETPYGVSNVSFYFQYSIRKMRIYLNLHLYNFTPYTKDIKEEFLSYTLCNGESIKSTLKKRYNIEDLEKDPNLYNSFLNAIETIIVPKCEFIPFYIDTFETDGVMLSNYAKGKYNITSPCLGYNIKKHPEIMERLKLWIDQSNAVIKDDVFYCIYENHYPNNIDLYLRRYLEWSPVNKKYNKENIK